MKATKVSTLSTGAILLNCYLACLFSIATTPTHAQSTKPYNDRLLIVGGGGARGAWGAGYSRFLTDTFGPYRKAFGTSTGSLMIPLIVLDEFDKLRSAYTNVTQRSIFNVNPFNQKTGEIKGFNAVLRLICGRHTLGESHNLKKTIQQFLTTAEYDRIRTSPDSLEFTVTVADFTAGNAEYHSSRDIADYHQMVNWMWASGNEPLFMSYYNVGKHAYVDGGVLENVPLAYGLQYAMEHRYQDVDVIINKPKDALYDKEFKKRGILKGLARLIDLFTIEIRNDDLLIPEIDEALASCKDSVPSGEQLINIHLHYFPSRLFTGLNLQELLFDKGRMTELWNAGEAGEADQQLTLAHERTMTVPAHVMRAVLNKFNRKQAMQGR